MPKLEVFFDYTCPYCNNGYRYLTELLEERPDAEIDLRPIEAHPSAEEPWHRPFTNLAVQGALFLRDNGGDERAYAERLFRAVFEEKIDVEDIDVLAVCASDAGADAAAFAAALREKTYEPRQLAANDYAYETQRVWAVPTFVCGERRLDAAEGAGVTKEQLAELLSDCFG
jgi:predicted DsbA family dithiol-disulfide isomerase